ncbi:SDR family NAD(P)-dependent oxidoreductase [Actinacidiphila oryziradicis]|uniref:SDR family NAD(P)-dependent oxidoreductase n=1 Tax=Actinacidiphila oryziradicis TaxID=2571141 RepID=A0A4U0SKD2_9ACTN|nr:SDR family NAD(P)-dependent oxidoreductase [Actinacidiphila oryziradicis]TKA09613.1 SDR family NAD(P)-dependent oxidoreductase [Actinacidiphila oryziradicis]
MDHAQSAEHARTVVITGASAGIGRAVVRGFTARGDRLALIRAHSRSVRLWASQHHDTLGAAAQRTAAAVALRASRCS